MSPVGPDRQAGQSGGSRGEGHLHVETALSHWGHEGSHSATLAWARQYMSMVNQAEQQIPHLL